MYIYVLCCIEFVLIVMHVIPVLDVCVLVLTPCEPSMRTLECVLVWLGDGNTSSVLRWREASARWTRR